MSKKSSLEKKTQCEQPSMPKSDNAKSMNINPTNHSHQMLQRWISGVSGTTSNYEYTSLVGTHLPPSEHSLVRFTDDTSSNTTYPQYTRYDHGRCGLNNLGNTCFMNSILQCVNNIPPLVNHYQDLYHRYLLSPTNQPVSTEFAKLIESMRTSCTVRPIALINALCRHASPLFDYAQQDAHECLTFLLDVLHRESIISAKDNDDERSIITNLFRGKMQYTIKCSSATECKNVTETVDPFLDIPLFIDDKITTTVDPIFKVRFFLTDGQQKMVYLRYSPTDTIQSIINHLQKTLNLLRKTIIAMKISNDNTFSVKYRSSVYLSQIDDQSTIFYELDDSNTDPVITCFFLEKTRSSFNQIYNSPPALVKLPAFGATHALDYYLSNHFDSYDTRYETGEDPFIDIKPKYLSSQKPLLVYIDEKIIRRSQLKLESKAKKLTVQTQQESSVKLEECLRNNISVIERMSPNSVWFCPQCQLNRQLTKENHILSLPQVLIIHLKRFNIDSSSRRRKIEAFINYPLELNMNEFLSSATSHKGYIYDLIGVCLHSGSFESGHYTAYTKEGSGWFCFDDSFVHPMSVNDVVNRNAYILFYLRRDH